MKEDVGTSKPQKVWRYVNVGPKIKQTTST